MSPCFRALLPHCRGLDTEIACVTSFSNHELLRWWLMLAVSSPAPDQRSQLTSFEHVLSSDQWALLLRRCASGIRKVGGKLPHDMHPNSTMSDFESSLALSSSSES